MKIRLLAILAGSAISFALPTFAQLKEVTDPQVRQQLDALAKSYDTAFNKQDVAGIMATFTPDAVETGPDGPATGTAELQARYTKLFEKWHPTDHLNTIEKVYQLGSDVYVVQRWSVEKYKGWVTLVEVPKGNQWLVQLVTFNISSQPAAATTPVETEVDPNVLKQIEALMQQLDQAIDNHDPAAVVACCAANAVMVHPFGTFVGHQEIEKCYAKVFQSWPNIGSQTDQIVHLYNFHSDVCGTISYTNNVGGGTRNVTFTHAEAILGRSR